MNIDIVNELQGKSKSKTDSCYFIADPINLKRVYVEHIDVLLFNVYVDVDKGNDFVSLLSRIEYIESLLENK